MSDLQKLKTLLEGKTILKIEKPGANEAICKFVLSDGSSFRLHATDLGYWTEQTKGDNGYPTFHAMMTDYGHHMYSLEYDDEDHTRVSIQGQDRLQLQAPDNRIFTIPLSRLTNKELAIINHPIGKKLFDKYADMGSMWYVPFVGNSNNEKCPSELKITDKELENDYS